MNGIGCEWEGTRISIQWSCGVEGDLVKIGERSQTGDAECICIELACDEKQ